MPALEASKYPLEQDASIHAPKHSLTVLKHCFPTTFGEIQHNDKYKLLEKNKAVLSKSETNAFEEAIIDVKKNKRVLVVGGASSLIGMYV